MFTPLGIRSRRPSGESSESSSKMVMHTIFQKLPVSEGVKVVLGCSVIFGISGYWVFMKNSGMKGYDNMEEKSESQKAFAKQRGSGASPFSS